MKYEKPKERFIPPENLPNQVIVPKDTLLVITENDYFNDLPEKLIEDLKGNKKRDWFHDHAYFCLPLSIGNQHGFIIKAAYDFQVFWDGGKNPSNVIVQTAYDKQHLQKISSHFGMGTVTIQNRWQYRTSEGVNLLIFNPPNYYIDGIIHMTAMVETDNLRRDFTFNLKITRPNTWIEIKEGTPIGCVLPYPRHYFDNFKIKLAQDVISKDIIEEERRTANYAGIERSQIDSKYKGGNGYRYMNGEDIYGCPFKDHQKTL